MLGVVALVLAVVCKRMQQLPTMLGQQCWELSRWCWQWCANGCNNSQQCWDLQCIRGRMQPISLWKPSVMRVRCPNNVGRAVQTDPTLLRYASVIAKQKKCLESLAQSLTTHQFKTLRNNYQPHATECANKQQCWELLVNNVASFRTGLKSVGCQWGRGRNNIFGVSFFVDKLQYWKNLSNSSYPWKKSFSSYVSFP